jgi:hypothetical protein
MSNSIYRKMATCRNKEFFNFERTQNQNLVVLLLNGTNFDIAYTYSAYADPAFKEAPEGVMARQDTSLEERWQAYYAHAEKFYDRVFQELENYCAANTLMPFPNADQKLNVQLNQWLDQIEARYKKIKERARKLQQEESQKENQEGE